MSNTPQHASMSCSLFFLKKNPISQLYFESLKLPLEEQIILSFQRSACLAVQLRDKMVPDHCSEIPLLL